MQAQAKYIGDVVYELNGVGIADLTQLMVDYIQYAYQDGRVTGDTEAETDSFSVHVELIDPTRREINERVVELEKYCSAHNIMCEDLDDLVHDVMSERASQLNNEGLSGQLSFLLLELGEQEFAEKLAERVVLKQQAEAMEAKLREDRRAQD